jgi:hypothetical protein
VVHRAIDLSTNRRVALKQLQPRASRNATLGFRREFHTLASLKHPNIVEVFDFGVDPKGPFYTMELLDTRVLQRARRLPPERVSRVLLEVSAALAFLHSRRLLHGDISKRNVACSEGGVAKLLDFGLLATLGELGNGRGTLPYMPPEVVRRGPVDHRADIYSLGALAYSLLAGHHAFPARTGKELEKMWERRPSSPSELNGAVPLELGDLVVSMMSIDPLGRPSSAAEVIDRVRALLPAPVETMGGGRSRMSRVARLHHGTIASSALVGRQREMQLVHDALARTRDGRGEAVLVEAPSGLGKSRLLRVSAVEGQMAGARVLSTRCHGANRGPYGAIYDLVRGFLRSTTPEDGLTVVGRAPGTRETGQHERDGAIPALLRWVGERDTSQVDVLRARIQFQRRLVSRMLQEARRQPLVLVVDDVQRCDEASAAVLAALAHQSRSNPLLLVCSCRTDEDAAAPVPVDELRRHACRVPLGGLNADAVEKLARATFGDVENVERLAAWMHSASGGSPLWCEELARHLVEEGRVRYEDGVWRIPSHLGQAALPPGLRNALAERISSLGLDAEELVEALAVHGGEVTLETCVALAEGDDEAAAFEAINELVERGVVVGRDGTLRFYHDGIREAVQAGLSRGRRRELHLRVGKVLRELGAGSEEAVGWHLLKGGEDLEGARLLARAGMRHFRAQSFSDSISPLEAALEVYDRHDTLPRLRCQIRQDLVRAGVICDREVALRHGPRVLQELHASAGLNVTERLGPWIGRWLALGLAVVLAAVRRLLTRPSRRGPPVIYSISTYVSMVAYLATARALSFDLQGVRQMPALFDVLPRRMIGFRTANALCRNLERILTGRWEDTATYARHYLRWLPRLRRLAHEPLDLQLGEGAMRYMLAMSTANMKDNRCLDHLRKLESMDLQFLEVSARVGRVLYHRLRGEEALADQVEEETKLTMVQVGSMWLWESQLVWVSAVAHCFTANLLALRRSIEDLEQLIHRGVKVEPFLELARAVYRRERGELEASRRGLADLLKDPACQHNPLVHQATLALLARTLLAQDDREGGAAVARQAMHIAQDPEVGVSYFLVQAGCTRAVAEAESGNHERAMARLAFVEQQVQTPSPLLLGTIEECRAVVALCADDAGGACAHLEQMDRWFRSTGSAALAARVEKLAAKVTQKLGGDSPRPRRMTELPTQQWQQP